ncbi:hypothetical protein SAMN05216439_0158 [Methanobrevibacter gottschalkii]|uniref:Uncharacterized protein n=1 Tax=Methanobrevibacter gottschalkii TaxID=190974 RepID=A0A1H7NB79_9EURY|nr:hypothetical protein [Methanobrevibacter gottschalkii]SEL20852.1 hypothetical protein SAMN05216439_0158 [Methanobrevibacter gottschalkii]
MNTTKNQSIVYDEKTIFKVKEMIVAGLNKLKLFKCKKSGNLDFYNDLKETFTEIALNLKELKLWNELDYFLSISLYIEYIVYKNSIDSSFGHCSFAIELLNFYINLIKTSSDYYLNLTEMSIKDFGIYQNETKTRYRQYRRKFHTDVYVLSGDFTEDQMYEIHASLRE